MTNTQLVSFIKQYALNHYEDGGWDVIVECWDDSQIAELLVDCDSEKKALNIFADVADVYADQQADAVNSAF